MSAEATEIHIIATATHPVHGRVIVFDRTDKHVFVAPVEPEYPWYSDDFSVPVATYEKDYAEEGGIMLEATCPGCGAMSTQEDVPDHEISRADAEWRAYSKLFRCCGTGQLPVFEWRRAAK